MCSIVTSEKLLRFCRQAATFCQTGIRQEVLFDAFGQSLRGMLMLKRVHVDAERLGDNPPAQNSSQREPQLKPAGFIAGLGGRFRWPVVLWCVLFTSVSRSEIHPVDFAQTPTEEPSNFKLGGGVGLAGFLCELKVLSFTEEVFQRAPSKGCRAQSHVGTVPLQGYRSGHHDHAQKAYDFR